MIAPTPDDLAELRRLLDDIVDAEDARSMATFKRDRVEAMGDRKKAEAAIVALFERLQARVVELEAQRESLAGAARGRQIAEHAWSEWAGRLLYARGIILPRVKRRKTRRGWRGVGRMSDATRDAIDLLLSELDSECCDAWLIASDLVRQLGGTARVASGVTSAEQLLETSIDSETLDLVLRRREPQETPAP